MLFSYNLLTVVTLLGLLTHVLCTHTRTHKIKYFSSSGCGIWPSCKWTKCCGKHIIIYFYCGIHVCVTVFNYCAYIYIAYVMSRKQVSFSGKDIMFFESD